MLPYIASAHTLDTPRVKTLRAKQDSKPETEELEALVTRNRTGEQAVCLRLEPWFQLHVSNVLVYIKYDGNCVLIYTGTVRCAYIRPMPEPCTINPLYWFIPELLHRCAYISIYARTVYDRPVVPRIWFIYTGPVRWMRLHSIYV